MTKSKAAPAKPQRAALLCPQERERTKRQSGNSLRCNLPPQLADLMGNVALVTAGLYAARGAAVGWSSAQFLPFPMLLALVLGLLFISLVLLPVVVGGLFALGLADTWLDFRRRYAASS